MTENTVVWSATLRDDYTHPSWTSQKATGVVECNHMLSLLYSTVEARLVIGADDWTTTGLPYITVIVDADPRIVIADLEEFVSASGAQTGVSLLRREMEDV